MGVVSWVSPAGIGQNSLDGNEQLARDNKRIILSFPRDRRLDL